MTLTEAIPRASRAFAVLTALLATVAVYSTARVFSGTADEPMHIAVGMQWLTTHQYDYDLQHPPLSRLAAAIGPYLAGAHFSNAQHGFDEGAQILGTGEHYEHMLALARHGELPFLVLLFVAVWLWGRRLLGDVGAALSVFFVATNPNILAHAGLATTDIAVTATVPLALYAATQWFDEPSLRRALVFGLCFGLAMASKFSAVAFVGGPIAVAYLLRGLVTRTWRVSHPTERRSVWMGIGAAALLTCFMLWAAYRFQIGRYHGVLTPAPMLVRGLSYFLQHGNNGHPGYLLGVASSNGWWYYFLVAVLVKTPFPLLLLFLAGALSVVARVRATRDWQIAVPLIAVVVILAVGTRVRVNIGLRHVLPLYPMMAIVAAQGALYLWEQHRGTMANRAGAVVLGLLAAITVVRAHPDYLAYFNPLGGTRPEIILVDSNLDWGQDLYRLRDTLQAHGATDPADTVHVAYFGTADVWAVGIRNAQPLGFTQHPSGWVAVSKTYLMGEWVGDTFKWLTAYPPVAEIGHSMYLWHLPPPQRTTSQAVTTPPSPHSGR